MTTDKLISDYNWLTKEELMILSSQTDFEVVLSNSLSSNILLELRSAILALATLERYSDIYSFIVKSLSDNTVDYCVIMLCQDYIDNSLIRKYPDLLLTIISLVSHRDRSIRWGALLNLLSYIEDNSAYFPGLRLFLSNAFDSETDYSCQKTTLECIEQIDRSASFRIYTRRR
jgi:hypothetical protein